jgi:hypothetical protein
LHIKAQKYGFYPIFLLILQVGQTKLKNYQKGTQNNLDDNRHHHDPPDGIDAAPADADDPDLYR